MQISDDVALVWRIRGRRARIQLEPLSDHLPPATTSPPLQSNHGGTSSPAEVGAGLTEETEKAAAATCTSVPESVLQYERQLRKAQHAKKAGAILSDDDLRVVHADDHVVVVSKPPGVLTVPGIRANPSILDLVHARFVVGDGGTTQSPEQLDPSRMIVHRLDMDTSGLVMFGLSKEATKRLHQTFRERDGVQKEYQALVMGHWPSDVDGGTIELPLQRDHAHPPFMRVSTPQSERDAQRALKELHTHGWKKLVRKAPKSSTTDFAVVERMVHPRTQLPCTRLQLKPVTGRTHQLRVHCAALGYPIVGDPTYSYLGEASAKGGIEHVPTVVLSATIAEADATEQFEPVAAPSQCPIDLQQKWNAQYVPNEHPMCLHASYLSLQHPMTKEMLSLRDDPAF
jgi:tRNA pseudouridine32 synthase / 23S rRNA pseudouridine746 synthase